MKYFLPCYNACESSLKQFKLESTSFWQYVDCKVFNASIHWKHKNILKTTFWVYVNSDLIIYFRIKDRTFLQYDRKLSIKIVNFQPGSYTFSPDRILYFSWAFTFQLKHQPIWFISYETYPWFGLVRYGPWFIFLIRDYIWSAFLFMVRSEIRFGRIIGRDFRNDVNSKLTISDRSGFSNY